MRSGPGSNESAWGIDRRWSDGEDMVMMVWESLGVGVQDMQEWSAGRVDTVASEGVVVSSGWRRSWRLSALSSKLF